MQSLMYVPVAVSEELKQTNRLTGRIALYILDVKFHKQREQSVKSRQYLYGILVMMKNGRKKKD